MNLDLEERTARVLAQYIKRVGWEKALAEAG